MSDTSIFEVQPPAWLQRLAQPADMSKTAKDLGIMFGAGLLALKQDPDKSGVNPDTGEKYSWLESRQGFNQKTLTDARQNMDDPNWRLKTKALEAQTVGRLADNKAAWLALDSQVEDKQAWANEDLPSLYKWRDALKDDPSAVPPVMKSKQGQAAAGQIESYLQRQQQQKWLNEYRNNQIELKKQHDQMQFSTQKAKIQQESAFQEAFAALQKQDPAAAAYVQGQAGEQWTDENGFLTPQAKALLAAVLKDHGIPLGVQEQKSALQEQRGETQKEVAGIAAGSREKVQEMRGEQAKDVEKMREKTRLEEDKIKGQLRNLQVQYNLKQRRLENLAKDPILSMAPENMGKAMAAVRKKKEEELTTLTRDVDAISEKMDALNQQIETGPPEPGTDYRPGSMNALPAAPRVTTQEQAKEAIDQANAALKKIGNNPALRQKVFDKLKALGVDFTLGTNAPAATSTNAIANP